MTTEGFSPLALAAFETFFRPWLRRRLHLRLAGVPTALPDLPLLLVSNHTSWWDPFVLREIQILIRPRAPVRTLMLRTELDSRPFLKRIGVIGLEPGSPGAIRGALRTLQRSVSAERHTVVIFFPQGRIWPSFRRPLGFLRGLDLFVSHLAPLTILPVGLHVEPMTRVAPVMFANIGKPLVVAAPRAVLVEVEGEVTHLLDEVIDHLREHGERAAEAWPPPSRSLDASRSPGNGRVR
jgi:1-acyl-sn-glycerol-3-phosphate acyltransferase